MGAVVSQDIPAPATPQFFVSDVSSHCSVGILFQRDKEFFRQRG